MELSFLSFCADIWLIPNRIKVNVIRQGSRMNNNLNKVRDIFGN